MILVSGRVAPPQQLYNPPGLQCFQVAIISPNVHIFTTGPADFSFNIATPWNACFAEHLLIIQVCFVCKTLSCNPLIILMAHAIIMRLSVAQQMKQQQQKKTLHNRRKHEEVNEGRTKWSADWLCTLHTGPGWRLHNALQNSGTLPLLPARFPTKPVR